MTFQSTVAAAEFAEKISAICPCKLSPVNAAAPGSAVQAPPYAHTKVPTANQGSHEAASSDPFTESQSSQFPFVGQPQVYQASTHLQSDRSRYATPQHSDDNMFQSSQITSTVFNLPTEFSVPYRHPSTTALSRSTSQTTFRLPTNDISATQPLTTHNLDSSLAIGPKIDNHPEIPIATFDQKAKSSTNPLARSRTMAPVFETNMEDLQEYCADANLIAEPEPDLHSQWPVPCSASDNNVAQPSVHSAPAKTMKTSAASRQRFPETPEKTSEDANPLIESLYEACNLDHLPVDELEKLIAHFIREDGFAQLVRFVCVPLLQLFSHLTAVT